MANSKKETIVVVGYGWVGQANALALAHDGEEVYYFDIASVNRHYTDKYGHLYERVKPLSSLLHKDSFNTWYIVCIGDKVSLEGEQDILAIRKALETLKKAVGKVLLRSTILPGYLETLQFDIYMPEFLHEKKAVEESINPLFFVIGKKNKNISLPNFLQRWRGRAVKHFIGNPSEASHIKYLSNTWNAIRIAFVNEFGNAIAHPNSKEDVANVEKIVNFLFEEKSYLRYGRSYGGHCLPKDTRAFFNWYKKQGKSMHLLEGMHNSNLVHCDIEKNSQHLPEWFSDWIRPQISGRVALTALRDSIIRKTKQLFIRKKSKAKLSH